MNDAHSAPPEHPGREIDTVERRLRWAFVGIALLCTIVLVLAAFLLWRWQELSTVVLAVTLGLVAVALSVMFYAFDSLHRTTAGVRERLEALTFIDEATGVYNYRYLEIRLQEEMERVRRYRGSTALLYLDLDRFKLVNDRFGHQVGNVVLREIAQRLRSGTRSCDILGRLGGDEFLGILPDTSAEKSLTLADRLIQSIREYTYETRGGALIDFVTLKVGIAAFPENGEDMDQVIQAADSAVYQAKAQGGNCACLAEGVAADAAPRQGSRAAG
jgi:diguanylate cyclase (GGDEF)-like protein